MEAQNSIIYLYGFSPRQSDKLDTLVKILREQAKSDILINVVLIQDGVIGSTKKEETPELLKVTLNLPVKVYSIIQDVKARGMDPNSLIDGIKGLDYNGLVDLLVGMTKIVSWM